MTELKCGDVVVLKSDLNVKMTVHRISISGDVSTMWFSGTLLRSGNFQAAALKKLKSSDDE